MKKAVIRLSAFVQLRTVPSDTSKAAPSADILECPGFNTPWRGRAGRWGTVLFPNGSRQPQVTECAWSAHWSNRTRDGFVHERSRFISLGASESMDSTRGGFSDYFVTSTKSGRDIGMRKTAGTWELRLVDDGALPPQTALCRSGHQPTDITSFHSAIEALDDRVGGVEAKGPSRQGGLRGPGWWPSCTSSGWRDGTSGTME